MKYEEMKVANIELRKPTKDSKVVAIVDISIHKIFQIRGIHIIPVEHEGHSACAVVMPEGKHLDGFSYNIFDCAEKDGRDYLRAIVLDAYRKTKQMEMRESVLSS